MSNLDGGLEPIFSAVHCITPAWSEISWAAQWDFTSKKRKRQGKKAQLSKKVYGEGEHWLASQGCSKSLWAGRVYMLTMRRLSMLVFRHSWVSLFDACFEQRGYSEPLHACAGWVVLSFHCVVLKNQTQNHQVWWETALPTLSHLAASPTSYLFIPDLKLAMSWGTFRKIFIKKQYLWAN